MSASTENFQRRALRRNRLIATALLGTMAILFIVTTLMPQPGFWIRLVRAAAEAAVIGGLADWFAVTALFRQPLGLPIPHTAILPKSKDRIGQGLATFIERNFLTPDLIRAKLRSIDIASGFAHWLASPENADAVADRVVRVSPHLLDVIDDREVREFLNETLAGQFETIELAPVLGRVITVLTANGFHETLIDRFLDTCADFLANREEQLYAAAEVGRRRWWIPKAANRQIAKVIIGGVKDIISNLREPGTVARQNMLHGIEQLAHELCTSPEYSAQIEAAKRRLLEDVEVKSWLESAWDTVGGALRADLASPTSRIRRASATAICAFGQNLLVDGSMRSRLNRLIEALAIKVVPWRDQLSQFIVDVVGQWDTKSFTERLEQVVGRDLQYIRISGTLIGALAGCLLYLLSSTLAGG
jgi:uncharacterized membrane-anchored protein YjiN (DUF445 family)